jgi:hypothetical protein
MDRQTALMIVSLTIGCARTPTETAVEPVRDGASDGRQLALAASPSTAATAMLPVGTSYRVVLGSDGTLALAIVAPDQRLLGRMAIAAGAGPHGSVGVRVEFEDVDGQTMHLEAWSSAGAVHGQAFVGARSIHFRARQDDDGSLAGERWSLAQRDAIDELVTLQRARALGAELGGLTTGLTNDCVLVERIALAELALELSIRAWAGHGRSRLPTIYAIDDPCPL